MRQQSGRKDAHARERLLHPHPTIPHHRLILQIMVWTQEDRKQNRELPTLAVAFVLKLVATAVERGFQPVCRIDEKHSVIDVVFLA